MQAFKSYKKSKKGMARYPLTLHHLTDVTNHFLSCLISQTQHMARTLASEKGRAIIPLEMGSQYIQTKMQPTTVYNKSTLLVSFTFEK